MVKGFQAFRMDIYTQEPILTNLQDMDMSSDHYHSHKDVLCWDCNNLIKNSYENAIVWGEIRTEKWIVYI